MGLLLSRARQVLGGFLVLALMLVSPVFLVVARTFRGRLAGAGGLVAAVTFVLLLTRPAAPPLDPLVGLGGCLVTALGIMVIFFWLPDTDVTQLLLLATRLDPRVPPAEGRAARARLRGLLARVDADPEARAERPLWPALILAFAGNTKAREGHRFFYRPEPREPGERLGLLVALHGHGGNSRVWLEAWKAFADEHRLAVMCPTFGYGNWEHPDGVLAVQRCLDDRSLFARLDPDRVYLAGISQGGCGVGRAGRVFAGRFAGLIFLSPTMEPAVLGSDVFAAGWRGRPVLVVYGGRDRHVTAASVAAGVLAMRAGGAEVTAHADPGAGHFLFFAKPDEVAAVIGAWMTARPAREDGSG